MYLSRLYDIFGFLQLTHVNQNLTLINEFDESPCFSTQQQGTASFLFPSEVTGIFPLAWACQFDGFLPPTRSRNSRQNCPKNLAFCFLLLIYKPFTLVNETMTDVISASGERESRTMQTRISPLRRFLAREKIPTKHDAYRWAPRRASHAVFLFALFVLALTAILGLVFSAARGQATDDRTQQNTLTVSVQRPAANGGAGTSSDSHQAAQGYGGGNMTMAAPQYQGDGLNCHVRQPHLAKQNATYCNGSHNLQPVVDNLGSTVVDPRYTNANGGPITLGDEAALDYAAYEQQQLGNHPLTAQDTNNHAATTTCAPWDISCGAQEALKNILQSIFQSISSAASGTVAELTSLGFMYVTPSVLSYGNGVVLAGYQWSLAALDVAVGLMLVIGGYRLIMNDLFGLPKAEVMQAAIRFLLPLVAAHVFMIFAGPIIELFNTLNMDVMNTLGGGKILQSNPDLGTALNQGIMSAIFAIINLVFMLLLSIEMAVNLALVDLALIFAPWGLAVGGAFRQLWATTLVSALVAKLLQVATVSVGAALAATIGTTTTVKLQQTLLTGQVPITSAFVALACFYLAFKLPSMLFSNALKSSVGAVHRDIVLTYFAIDRFIGGPGRAGGPPSDPSLWVL
jgi:hypothetical protein